MYYNCLLPSGEQTHPLTARPAGRHLQQDRPDLRVLRRPLGHAPRWRGRLCRHRHDEHTAAGEREGPAGGRRSHFRTPGTNHDHDNR